mgnify:CR=1 FL=1
MNNEEVYRTQIDADGFLIDIVFLSDGQKVVSEDDMFRFLTALSNGELTPTQVVKIRDSIESLTK